MSLSRFSSFTIKIQRDFFFIFLLTDWNQWIQLESILYSYSTLNALKTIQSYSIFRPIVFTVIYRLKLSDVRASSNWGNRCIIVDNIYDRLTCVLICTCLCTPPNEFVNTIFRNIFLNWQEHSPAQNAPYILKHQSQQSLYENRKKNTFTMTIRFEAIWINFRIIQHSSYIKT